MIVFKIIAWFLLDSMLFIGLLWIMALAIPEAIKALEEFQKRGEK